MSDESSAGQQADSFGCVTLNDVEVRTTSNEVCVDDAVVRIKPKAMGVLVELIAACGEVVSKDQILDRVWPNMAISDRTLTEAIHELRRALGDDAKRPRFIQTIPRRGYRLVARVESARETIPAADKTGKPRIAVLGFKSLSDEPEDRYFCEGLSEELINSLGKFGQFEVLARSSTISAAIDEDAVKELAKRLGATHLVRGTLRKYKHTLRVIAHLIDGREATELWSSSFDSDIGNIIEVQDKIAQQIGRAVAPRLFSDLDMPAGERYSPDAEAFRQFSKGRYFWKQDNSNPGKAMVCYEEAMRIDPHYAAPYAGMVECYNTLGVYHLMTQADAREASIRHAEQAIFFDPDSSESLFAFGYTQFYMRWNWAAAETAFLKCLAINPNHALAHLFLALLNCPLRRRKQSRRHVDIAISLDPFSPLTWWIDFLHHHYFGDLERALISALQGIELAPGETLLQWALADTLVHLGRKSEGLSNLRKLEVMAADFPLFRACAAILYATLDRPEDTIRIAGEMGLLTNDNVEDSFIGGMLSIYLGETGRALELLDRAVQEHDALSWIIACEPYFDPLRGEEQFEALLHRLELAGK